MAGVTAERVLRVFTTVARCVFVFVVDARAVDMVGALCVAMLGRAVRDCWVLRTVVVARDGAAVREMFLLDVVRELTVFAFCVVREVMLVFVLRDTAFSSRTAPLVIPTVAKIIAIKIQAFLIRCFMSFECYQKIYL